jgi:hypothetical protein
VAGRKGGAQVDHLRGAHESSGQILDRGGHRGREHHRLAVGRNDFEDAEDLRQEAEVEHVVGFVQDQLFDPIEP